LGRWPLFFSFLVALIFCVAHAPAQDVALAALPDAPVPQQFAPTQQAQSAAVMPMAPLPYAPFYARTIQNTQRARPLTATGKLRYVAHEMVRPINLLPASVSAGYGVYNNSNPKYGQSAEAFGQRFAAAYLRETSYRLFADGLLPIALREDPRYYKLGRGGLKKRTLYAFSRVFVTHSASGATTPNYSAILGRGFGAVLVKAYYPQASQGSSVILQTFGTSLAGEMGVDFLREFLPGKLLAHF
jgi:hypothetical protein